jgi:hypothetical protein
MKKPTKTEKLVHRAFSEVHANTPKQVKRTYAMHGPDAAKKQRTAIALSKAREAGARIPKPK